jgi:predicted small secreted protein
VKKFTFGDGLVPPLGRANVDTDALIPKQFLKSIKRSGLGQNLFDEWRYLDHGEPEIDAIQRKPNADGFYLFIIRKGVSMKMLPVIFALITVFGLSGCNTFAGMGKDIQSGGKAVEETAK